MSSTSPPTTAQALRTAWQDFFVARGHTAYPSASLVPANDPTLLFTGAGMNQFKDMFLGKGSHPFKRAATVQKCLRAGDIDNVGKTLRHFTFFEMLGNFSFDDYFKAEAIAWAVEFTFGVLKLPRDRVVVTVYTDDDASFAEWRRHGIPAERILRFDAKDNFWPANAPQDGPNGPCGPCTEMYYDATPELPLPRQGVPELDSNRFLEFWNLVFPQFDRQGVNDLRSLGRQNVDTGAGLERMLAVVEGHVAPFHTSVMMPIVQASAKALRTTYVTGKEPQAHLVRRVADHLRTAVLCVADGVKPSNEHRGYVLRRILRRAIRDGIGAFRMEGTFLHALVPSVVTTMRDAYPTLHEGEASITATIRAEEEQFRATYAKGIGFFEDALPAFRASGRVPGAVAFKLHDTYGFPIDLLTQIAEEEHRLTVDRAGFEKELEGQRERARAGSKMAGDVFATGPLGEVKARGGRPTEFVGYPGGEGGGCVGTGRVVGLIRGGKASEEATAGDEVSVVLDRTPFYAEGGGQVGDAGTLGMQGLAGREAARVRVRDTKGSEGFSLHVGVVEAGTVRVGDEVTATVDRARRDATRRNHTATHLLHEALKRVLGAHVEQQGSLVAPDRLRFDFRHGKPMTAEELQRIEDLINAWVVENAAVDTQVMDTSAAKASGAVALFGENYGDRVRVVDVTLPASMTPSGGGAPTGERVSRELCGGTHVARIGDIGSFRITGESSVASGVRRVEAVTGLGATAAASADRERLREIGGLLKAPADQLVARITALQDELREVRKQQEKAAAEAGAKMAERLVDLAVTVKGIRTLVADVRGIEAKGLRGIWDTVVRAGVEVALLVGEAPGNGAPLLAGASASAIKKGAHAGNLLKAAVAVLGGNGGGGPPMAQGQGLDRSKVLAALEAVRGLLESSLKE